MSRRNRSNCGGSDAGIVALALGLVFLPFVGLFMMCSSDPDNQATGRMLLAIGVFVYVLGFIGQLG